MRGDECETARFFPVKMSISAAYQRKGDHDR